MDRVAKAVGGGATSAQDRSKNRHDLKALELLWKVFLVVLKHGNAQIYYHICAGGDPDGNSWDVPMQAENVEVRQGYCGAYVTIF